MPGPTEAQHHDDTPVLQLDLQHSREAPSVARAAIAGFSAGRDIDQTAYARLTLLVSEIVTNAVIHPDVELPTTIRLCARIARETIRVEVTDQGSGFTLPPSESTRGGGGYGLYILEKEAERWGVDQQHGTTVWFEMTIEPA